MNSKIYSQAVRLIGKLILKYDINLGEFDGSDRELLETAARENVFYGHTKPIGQEAVEAGNKRKSVRAA